MGNRLLRAWERYWFAPAPAETLALVRIVCCALCFLVYVGTDIRPWTNVSSVFWTPISFFRILAGAPRDQAVLGFLQTFWKVSLLTSMLGCCTRLSLFLAALLGFFVLGLPNCFGKIHHLDGFAVLLLFILLTSRCSDALSIDRLFFKRPQSSPSGSYTWPIRIAQALFLLIFFAAGIAKLRHTGLSWMEPQNMRFLLLANFFNHEPPTRWALWLASSNAFCAFAAAATLVVELSALPAICLPALRVPVLIALLGLQAGISLLMGIYFVPYIAGYALFIPWSGFYHRVRNYV